MASATLTLSRVEQSVVLAHLQLQYDRLPTTVADKAILEHVMEHVRQATTVAMSKLETVVMLRHLRIQRMKMGRDMMELEERRIRGGFNGELDAAHRALDTDCTVLDDVIRRLWDMLAGP